MSSDYISDYSTVPLAKESLISVASTMVMSFKMSTGEYNAFEKLLDEAQTAAYFDTSSTDAAWESATSIIGNAVSPILGIDIDVVYVERFLDYVSKHLPKMSAESADAIRRILATATVSNGGRSATSPVIAGIDAITQTASQVGATVVAVTPGASDTGTYAGAGAAIGLAVGTLAAGVGQVPGAILGATIGFGIAKVKGWFK